ncbi:MAG: DUF308 domain-containing protein [Akkermansia sp.]|nr:DUF308 domain-containing protein [Akkermansia sp.]
MNTDNQPRCLIGSPWLAGIIAVLELVLGFVMLSFPYLLGMSAVWVAGFVFVMMGLLHFVHVFTRPGHRWWSLLSAVLFIIIGIILLLQIVISMEVITLFIGVSLMVGGVLRFMVAFNLRRNEGSVWRFFNAAISLLLGIMVVCTWPESSLWLIGSIIAVEMIFSGWALLFLVLSPRSESV